MSSVHKDLSTSQQNPVPSANRGGFLADVAVITDGSDSDAAALSLAETVVSASGAHLAALYLNYVQLGAIPMGPGSSLLMEKLRENGHAAGDAVEAALRTRLEVQGDSFELRRSEGEIGDLVAAAVRMAGASDVVVVSGRNAFLQPGRSVIEALLFKAGAPVLIAPDEAKASPDPTTFPGTVVVGWRDTPECARAISGGLPFLKRAKSVILVNVAESNADEEKHREPMADAARHLSRHGVSVEIRHIAGWKKPADALINEAKMVGADMIILGAYGHSRVFEAVFGGVTREFLENTPLPVLFSR
ncbi:universal stress protein [Fulvimarina sp. MAC3]|uniref:universal stress protein n=1 Tax=Fulvimarina sp. MAC3 TaxID=3148887 RepID=UPI0031FD9FDE